MSLVISTRKHNIKETVKETSVDSSADELYVSCIADIIEERIPMENVNSSIGIRNLTKPYSIHR